MPLGHSAMVPTLPDSALVESPTRWSEGKATHPVIIGTGTSVEKAGIEPACSCVSIDEIRLCHFLSGPVLLWYYTVTQNSCNRVGSPAAPGTFLLLGQYQPQVPLTRSSLR